MISEHQSNGESAKISTLTEHWDRIGGYSLRGEARMAYSPLSCCLKLLWVDFHFKVHSEQYDLIQCLGKINERYCVSLRWEKLLKIVLFFKYRDIIETGPSAHLVYADVHNILYVFDRL